MPALRSTECLAILGILGLLIFGGIVFPPEAEALHDQGYICYVCHSLNPSEIRTGSNSIRWEQPVLTPVPISPSGSQAWSGGMPITCDFCHRATGDVPIANFASKAVHHPVRTISDNGTLPNEIACGDCHNADVNGNGTKDLAPATMTTKTTTDGYPDHDNVTAGYAHDLTTNLPHLTVPYWGASLPGATRGNDTTFWTNVRLGTQDMVCWVCHEGAGRTNTPTQAPLTGRSSTLLVKEDYTGSGSAKGHQIRTNAGGSQLGVGAALPCYDCHDSHGSVNNGLVLDTQSIYGTNTSRVAATTYNQGSRPYNDRVVCAQCHDTGRTTTGTGTRVEGLDPMDPFNSSATIHGVAAGFADNMLAGTKNCMARNSGCHANPHNPIGESAGGLSCATCHAAIYQAMDAGSNTGYHHVMLADNAPVGGTYPTNAQPTTTTQDRTCLVCHVDHNYFSKLVDPGHLRAQNLRADITQQPDNITANRMPVQTDYDNTLTRGGICTSCHENRQEKSQPGTNIRNDGSTYTPLVSKLFYDSSAHNYPSSSPYIQGHFTSDNADVNSYYRANCTKCHNDTLGTAFQNGSFTFALHASDGTNAVNRLLAPLGYAPLTDNLSENFCYRCHSHSTDTIAGTRKSADARDWYNNRAMTQAAENVWGDFQRASRHPVASADQKGGTAVVDCVNCHNVHLTRSATGSIVAYPDNTYAFDNYVLTDNTQAGKQNRARFCLRCHDGTPPAYVVSATSYVPLTVRLDNASMNQAAWGSLPDNATNRGHWNVYGQFLSTSIETCDACHDKHGSTLPRLIEATVNGQAVTGNNNTLCQACHNAAGAGYPAQEAQRTGADNGYFNPAPVAGVTTTTRWPGFTVWANATYSPHGATARTFGGFDGISRNVSDCRSCHDVHGTSNPYDMLKAAQRAGNYALCFGCHGNAGGPAGTDNIARYYTTVAGGAATDCAVTTNAGHNVRTSGGYLPQYANLPCYDCHVTHGSANGNTQLKSDQRWSSLGNTKYGATPSDNAADNASRIVCLGCHVASDDSTTTGTVENLQRQTAGTNRLKLPTANAIVEHTSAWLGQGCQRCHYGYTYLDNSFGPHYPATGLCDTCHESQGSRSAVAATYNGAHRTHTDDTLYKFACKQCHTWTATPSRAVHKNDNNATQHAEVRFDNQATSGWSLIQYATATQYEYRSLYASPYGASAPAPGYTPAGTDNATTDGRRASVRWTNGTCANVWCHSNANPVPTVQGALGVSNQYQGVTWMDNSLGTTCTGCHGGDATSGRRIGDNTAPTNGSISHLKHINGGAGCYKCHYYTVNTANNRQIDNLVSHVNGTKDVLFAPTVGGTWNNSAKTCAGTSCHGTPTPSPEWDNLATVTGCAVCHQSQGPGNTFTFTGPHQAHTDNATYKTACEACHANFASGAGPNAVHADGDNSVGNPRTVQVAFTDCAASQTYNSRIYYSSNVKFDPFLPGAVTPTYTENTAFVGGDNDSVNLPISWSRGTCNTVWCHSNANPLLGSGTTTYRAPQWAGAQPCTYCHAGAAAFASMQAADNLSRVHAQHAATNLYNFTCDACHASTAANDCTVAINGATGYDNHVNGVKTVRFDSNFRGSIDMSGGTYDNTAGNYRCYNIYCHSNGTDNGAFNTAAQWPVDNTVGWDNTPTATCRSCHGWTASSGTPIVTNAHDNHVNNITVLGGNYSCNECHNATVGSDNQTITGYAVHVNGYRNVVFLDCAATATYAQAPSRTCSNTSCHRQGNRSLGGAQDNLSIAWDCTANTDCRTCHGSKTGAGYTQFGASKLGEPNYDNAAFGGGQMTANSHYKHMRLPGADNTAFCAKCHPDASPTVANALATDNWTMHINDNVEVRGGNGASFSWTAASHRCGNISCHGGGQADWGQRLNCAGCHVSMGIENWTYNTGSHRVHTDNTQYRVACEVCHSWKSTLGNVGHGNGDNSAATQQYVEIRFTDNGSTQTYSANPTAYYSDNMFGTWYGRTWSPTYAAGGAGGTDNLATAITWSTGTCSNVYCHSNAGPLGGASGAVVRPGMAPAWGSVYPCDRCHSYRDAAANMLSSDNNLSRVHAQHVATNRYNFTCYECHGSTVNSLDNIAAYDNHVNGARNWKFGAAFRGSINQGGGSYSGSPNYQCTNLYCHSQGTDNGAFLGPLTTPRWDNTGNTGCRYCHGWTASSGTPIVTNAHDNHVNNITVLGGNYSCNECHNATVGSDNQTITGYAVHVNGYRNVVFLDCAATATYAQAPSRTCSNTSCHRQGNRSLGGAQDNLSIAWDCTANTDCRTCHGSKAVDGTNYRFASLLGEPNYDNAAFGGGQMTANSHRKHVTSADNTTVCSKCHPDASPTVVNALATDNWTMHINDNVEVRGGNGASFTWSAAGHSCTNISCHNYNATPAVWGASLNCQDCHTGTGDLEDFGTLGDPASLSGNGRTARVDTTEWTTWGHGRTTAYLVTGHPAANFNGTGQCQYCHQPAYAHDNTGNVFRLANYNYYGNGWNDVCLICHRASGHAGYNPGGGLRNATSAVVDNSHYGTRHTTTNNGGKFCYDCHDPHGDTNIFMVARRAAMRTDNTYGIPYRTSLDDNTYMRTVVFTDNLNGGNYASTDNVAPYDGVCEACHSVATHYRSTGRTDTTHGTTKCTTCHQHDRQFKGEGTCIMCHGSVQGTSPLLRRQVTGATGDYANGNAATHHITDYFDNTADGAPQNINCAKCHWEGWVATDTGYPGAGNEGKTNPSFHWADLGTNATARYVQLRVWSTTAAPASYSNIATGTAIEWRNNDTWNSAANAINLNRHCLGCHSSTIGAATPFSDGRSPRARAWDGLDIGDKYLRNGAANTVRTHGYNNTTYNVVPPLNKALSPHFDLQNNQRGVATTDAWGDDDSAGASNTATGSVACFDCHNSHASPVTGTATLPLVSYANNATLNGGLANANVGGLLKATTAGVSGYATTYTPVANATMNWGAGSAACFDCHVGSTAGGTPPKMYTAYGRGLDNIVAGYYDPVRWRTVTANRQGMGVWDTAATWEGSFSFKDSTIRATHFRNDSAIRALQTTPTTQLNGLCSRCHDPHGVTTNTTMVSNANYGSPALKGTWLASPYFEDRPGEAPTGTPTTQRLATSNNWSFNNRVYVGTSARGYAPRVVVWREYNKPPTVGGGYGPSGGGVGASGFYIDENTFGLTLTSNTSVFDMFGNNAPGGTNNVWANLWNGGYGRDVTININRITETNAQFAGLCERCHTPAALVNTASKGANIITHAHRTVKGWDALGGGPAAVDLFKNYMINNTTNNGTYSQRLVGAWAWNNMASNFSDYRAIEDPSEPWSAFPYHWGINLNRTGGQYVNNYIQSNYHQFPCSKCHTPHSSRLPRLLRTNCLDTGTVRGVNGGNSNNVGTTGSWLQRHSLNTTNNNVIRFRVTTNATHRWTPARAVRCHQDAYAINGQAANDTRWNDLTPW